jgi:hypothetical protein
MKKYFWNIWMNSKFNDKCPYKIKAEGDLRQRGSSD